MAFTCGFFNSENGDRKYNAEQMSAIFDGIIADGVFTTIGDHMAVSAGTGMQVLVGTGKAWFDHTWNVNDAAYPLAIAASDVTLSRIDAIVLETNHSDSVRLNKLRVVQGTVASSPAKPTLTNSEKVHQHPLAWVTVAPGVTQIAASAIENAVGTSACPFVTGIIATTAIDDLFNQWNGEFDEWFDNLKAQLSDNVVANLQKQIDANKTAIEKKVNKADKATKADVYSGTNDEKYVTPSALGSMCEKIGDVRFTTRTSIDDSWMLANGDSFDSNAYPAFLSYLSGSKTKWDDFQKVNGLVLPNTSSNPTGFYKIGEYYFINRDSAYDVSKDLQNWKNVNLPSNTYLHCVLYESGTYKFCARNSSSKTVIGITSNPMSSPSWTVTGMSSDFLDYTSMYYPIVKYGNYYVTCDNVDVGSSSSKYTWSRYYTTDLLGSSYTRVELSYRNPSYYLEGIVLVNSILCSIYHAVSSSGGIFIRSYSSVTDSNENGGTQIGYGLIRSLLIVGNQIYLITHSSSSGKFYVFYSTRNHQYTEISGISGNPRSLAKGDDGSAYLITSERKVYKLTNSTPTLVGTISSSAEPALYNQFLYSNNLISYGATDKYIYGGFRNTVPNITAPAGTRAFIKVKEIS